jgi:hypothetical protein
MVIAAYRPRTASEAPRAREATDLFTFHVADLSR